VTAVIQTQGLGKRYRRQWALSDCTLSVPAGHVVGLVGPNGAGKTTLLNLATGMLVPTAGTIEVLGGRPAAGPAQLAQVGYLAQDAPLYAGSCLVNPAPWREAGLMTQTQHGAARMAPPAAGQIPGDLADRYARDGYVILPAALTPAEVAELRAEALRICRGEAGPVAGMEPGPPDEPDEAVIRRYACIHFPHKLSPLMRQTLAHPAVVAALTRVIGPGSR
jgi:hypothetical protein